MNVLKFIVIIGIILLCWSFFVEPNWITIRHYNVPCKALSGLHAVFISDLHIKKNDVARVRRIVKLVNAQNPDIVLGGGDFANGHSIKSTLDIEILGYELSKIKAPYGFYTVLGNHDWWTNGESLRRSLEKFGINVLENSSASVHTGDGKYLYIAGLGDRDTREVKPKAALKNTSFPRILLTHHPDVFYEVDEQVDLMLAGHTHGGQVVLPLWGPILIPTDYPKKFAHGMVEENGNRIIVTKGIGTSILPIRFNCKPEIVVIDFI